MRRILETLDTIDILGLGYSNKNKKIRKVRERLFTDFNPLTPRRNQESPFTEISILF